jgi:hypothetical protein
MLMEKSQQECSISGKQFVALKQPFHFVYDFVGQELGNSLTRQFILTTWYQQKAGARGSTSQMLFHC